VAICCERNIIGWLAVGLVAGADLVWEKNIAG
jgi:hypothetical protein